MDMKTSTYIGKSFWGAAGVLVYVSLVAWIMNHSAAWFGNKPDNFLAPLLVLLLFVTSATITGLLVLGRPVNLYLEGHKKEAWTMLFWTVGWLVVFLIGVAVILIVR